MKSSLIMWSAILIYNRSWRLNWISQNFPLALHKKFPCNAIWNEILCGNAGLLTIYSDSWALISYQKWLHLTINALNALKIPEKINISTCPSTFLTKISAIATQLDQSVTLTRIKLNPHSDCPFPFHRKNSSIANINGRAKTVVNNCVSVFVSWENLSRIYLVVKLTSVRFFFLQYELLLPNNFRECFSVGSMAESIWPSLV